MERQYLRNRGHADALDKFIVNYSIKRQNVPSTLHTEYTVGKFTELTNHLLKTIKVQADSKEYAIKVAREIMKEELTHLDYLEVLESKANPYRIDPLC